MSVEDTLNNYLKIEKDALNRLMNGKMKGVRPEDPMFIKTHLKSRIELLENLKEDIIG